MKIQDMLVVSDLDGTLVPISGRISEENRSAIRRFRETGGTSDEFGSGRAGGF